MSSKNSLPLVKVEWEDMEDNVKKYPDHEFYALTRGDNLIYLGMANEMDAKNEAQARRKAQDLKSQGLAIRVGIINGMDTTFGRITNKIIYDTECLLIFTHQPSSNRSCTDTPPERSDFIVRNNGVIVPKYLRWQVRMEDGEPKKS